MRLRKTRKEVALLVRRGGRVAASELVRQSEGLGLSEAVRVADELGRAAAPLAPVREECP